MKSVLALLTLSIGLVLPVWAQEGGASSPPPAAGGAGDPAPAGAVPDLASADPAAALGSADDETLPLSQRVARRWYELRDSLVSPTAEGLEERLGELQKLRETAHLRGLPGPARGLAADGFRLLAEGDRETAAARFEAALELDPDAADARLGLAALARKKNPVSGSFFSSLWQANRARASSLRSAPYALANWSLLLAVALVLAGVGTLLALTFRFQGRFRHDVEEWLKRRVDAELAAPLAWAVLLLPLLLSFDLYWASLYWALVLWSYFGLQERIVGAVAVLCSALAVLSAGYSARMIGGVGDPYTAAASAYLEGFVDEPTLEALEAHLSMKPEDRDAAILRALIYQRNGEQRAAIQFWKQLASKGGRDAAVLNNLGNSYYRLDEKENALVAWNGALEVNPDFSETHYNLSLHYFAGFDFQRRDEHFNKAKQLNAAAVDRWVREGGGVIDAGIDPAAVRSRLLRSASAQGSDPFAAALRSPAFLGAILALAGAVALAYKRGGSALAQSCDKCGQAFCPECKPGKDRNALCLQCVHLFLRKDGVSPQMRSDKLKGIGRFQTLRRATSLALGALLPGAGQIYGRLPIPGFLLLLIWGVAISGAVIGAKLPPEPGLMARAAEVSGVTVSIVLGAVVWLAANAWNVARRS